MDFDEQYRVISARDRRFDGRFVTAVRSTGIYCRPSCPARTPRRENVTFFPTSAAAHAAGYRACKRCLPEAVPGSPDWNVRSGLAARAMRLIADGVVERAGVPGLAAQLGYTSRHVTRVLTDELGAGPLALARAVRAQNARTLLVSTSLPVTDVAYAAGFASVRQFNDTIREVFDLTPSRLRARSASSDGAPPGRVDLRLPFREPFDAPGVFAFLAARAVTGVEAATATTYARAVALPGGAASFEVRWTEQRELRLTASVQELRDLPVLLARVRRLFDLDADPVGIDAVLEQGALRPSIRGMRLPGAVDGGEILLRAIAGQQVTVRSAIAMLSELAGRAGTPVDTGIEGVERLFPRYDRVAEEVGSVYRGPEARRRALRTAAQRLADGSLALHPGLDEAELTAAVTALPGVGPWTAGYTAMRVLGSPDVVLAGDAALRTGARVRGLQEPLVSALRPYAPWRSYACMHLWRATEDVRTRKETAA
ncbi:DNA-3-methyladenine glycosylase 2 family protein [Naasia sp. SYSU D00948]|uniref:DNA-3-methyladenine glycosylase 2 family protein n=1 Tax=Naasia sp. SYSU D00948 TaxID=2817379 RepID=UPI001B317935|nr:AlkA N-terminal domain-containing protein [Naasia sp. SYSU D00948]